MPSPLTDDEIVAMSEPFNPEQLVELDPAKLQEVLDDDPNNWTDEQRLALIECLRRNRLDFVKADATAKATGKRVKSPKPKIDLKQLDIDLSSI